MTSTTSASGEALFLATLPVIEDAVASVCRRYHCSQDEQEDFASFVHLGLIEDDYAVLRSFQGRCGLRTYLGVVVKRRFLDFRRSRWGVWRPSARARRLGAEAVRLDMLLHRDGLSLDEAVQRMRHNEGVRSSPDELRALARQLPVRYRRRMEEESALLDLPLPARAALEEIVFKGERAARVEALRRALGEALAALAPQDLAILRLRYFDGFRINRIAERLGLPSKSLYPRLKRVLAGLRAALEAGGFEGRELGELIGDGAFEDELRGAPARGPHEPEEGE
jgi:RNA polymerase sigma factor (sigma-70 family)